MTFLEKALRENPQLDEQRITTYLCPSDLGYEQTPDGCTAATECIGKICGACWNRQADAAGGDTSSALRAPSPQGEGKTPPETEDRADEGIGPYGAMTGGEEAGADGV